MAKKKRQNAAPKAASQDKPVTLKDLLSPEVLDKLKARTEAVQAEEDKKKEDIRKQAEEARKAEQKKLENDFGHLLENSGQDWRKYK